MFRGQKIADGEPQTFQTICSVSWVLMWARNEGSKNPRMMCQSQKDVIGLEHGFFYNLFIFYWWLIALQRTWLNIHSKINDFFKRLKKISIKVGKYQRFPFCKPVFIFWSRFLCGTIAGISLAWLPVSWEWVLLENMGFVRL